MAGFIGQFGKRLADHLLARRHRARDTQVLSSPAGHAETRAPAGDKTRTKIAKKAAKAAAKKAKKEG